jgi:cellular nucleic acid-binding protein
MGRTQLLTLPAGTLSDPYHRGKEKLGVQTYCETCDRVIMSRDWPAHQNSKGHRTKKEATKNKENAKVTTDDNNGSDIWGGDASGFTADAGFNLASQDAGDGGWGTFGSGNNGGGGGGRACFNCGLDGYVDVITSLTRLY